MSRNTELQVDDLLNSFNTEAKTKGNKDNKKAKKGNDWDDDEEDNYSFGLGKGVATSSKTTKTTKKKTTADKGWGELAQEKKAEEEAQPVKEEVHQAEEPKKKGIFKKFTGESKPSATSINVEEEYFPTLGEEAKPQPKKKAEPVNTSPVQEQSAGGPRRFVNANKKAGGESFAPLNPELAEKPVPERPVIVNTANTASTEAKRDGFGFARRTEPLANTTPAPTTTTTTDDSKIKFGGEGPRKFIGHKISAKREEEKSEQEILREQKEREIEEKLAKEREEQARLRAEREARRGHKEEGGAKPEHKPEHTEEKPQENGAPTEERKPKFMNTKKDPSKPSPLVQAPVEKTEKPAPKVEEKEAAAPVQEGVHSAEKVVMNGTLSNKGWGEGPIKKHK